MYDTDGVLVAENDDRGDGSLNSQLQFNVPSDGAYEIVVRDFADYNGGDYILDLAIAAG